MERVVIGGERFVLKHLDSRHDWVARATGDTIGRPLLLWRSGLFDQLPTCIDHTVVGACLDGSRGAVLMRDVGPSLVPEGDDEIPLEQHLRFLDHMAQLHAAFWQWDDVIGLTPLTTRYVVFHRRHLPDGERAVGGTGAVPTQLVPLGWERFAERAPTRAVDLVFSLQDDPGALAAAMESTPQTLVHGDWKAGNLGSLPDGRTVLLDWAFPGRAPACADLAWYISLNRARLPHSKEAAITAYRESLERCGIDTEAWWEHQLGLCLLGGLVQMGWEKALGDDGELHWWIEAALAGEQWLS